MALFAPKFKTSDTVEFLLERLREKEFDLKSGKIYTLIFYNTQKLLGFQVCGPGIEPNISSEYDIDHREHKIKSSFFPYG